MATVNGFRMDDIIDLITESKVRVGVDELFALIRAEPPKREIRPKIELVNLIQANWPNKQER